MNCCNANGQCTGGPDCPVRTTHRTVHAPIRTHRCDELGVCNCSGQHCEFELPDLGPMTASEAALVCILGLASTVCVLGLLAWVLDAFGASISATASQWGRSAIELLLTTAALYS